MYTLLELLWLTIDRDQMIGQFVANVVPLGELLVFLNFLENCFLRIIKNIRKLFINTAQNLLANDSCFKSNSPSLISRFVGYIK